MNKTQKRILKDLEENKNELKRVERMHAGWSLDDIWWRVRKWEGIISYFLNSLGLFFALIILLITEDLVATLLFLIWIQLWRLDGNIRGFTLHWEGLIEWIIKKNI